MTARALAHDAKRIADLQQRVDSLERFARLLIYTLLVDRAPPGINEDQARELTLAVGLEWDGRRRKRGLTYECGEPKMPKRRERR